ncbi:hypothetical protein CFI10_14150 [Marinobacterium iners]|nr:hypothetical protein CFI10_14150 [Marinobacterium iners]
MANRTVRCNLLSQARRVFYRNPFQCQPFFSFVFTALAEKQRAVSADEVAYYTAIRIAVNALSKLF